MIDRIMLKSSLGKPAVGFQFVGMNRATRHNVFFDDRLKCFLANVRDNVGHYIAVALQHPKDYGFVRCAASTLPASSTPANVGFIGLNISSTAATQRPFAVCFGHVLANKMAHAPRRWVRHVQLALQFLRGNTVTRDREQMHGIEPLVQRQMAAMHDGSYGRMQLIFAVLANVCALARHAIELREHTADRTINLSSAVARHHKMADTGLVIRELLLEFVETCHRDLLYTQYSHIGIADGFDPCEIEALTYLVEGAEVAGEGF